MSKSLVSIIVPSFNQGQFIAETLNSILSQDYRPLEIIVVDGASSDDTVDILAGYNNVPEVHWISEPDRGVVDAVNKGISRARGELAAIQSSDDYYLPGAITTAIAALQQNPALGFVYGDILKVDVAGKELTCINLRPYGLADLLAMRTWIPQPSTFFRLERARELGGWRESVPYAADTDLWLRMAFAGKAAKIDAVLAARRIHPEQRDCHGDRIMRDYARMIEQLHPLRSAAPSLKRAARAGQLMLNNRYQPHASGFRQRCRLLKAVLLYPPLLQDIHPLALLPGGWFLRRHIASLLKRARHTTGALIYDLPRILPKLIRRDTWWQVCNRQDVCSFAPDGHGLSVDGLWSKGIHACTVFPTLGKLLMARALQQWPIRLAERPLEAGPARVTVVIPHRGKDREDQLRLCLASFLAQRGAVVECIVVEQSPSPELGPLPEGVRHIHLCDPLDPEPWRKSWAYNVGVAAASSDLVICHDGDILVPESYAAELLHRFSDPWLEVLHPQRFLFYLNPKDSSQISSPSTLKAYIPDLVSQNWRGGTLAIRKAAFEAIGGFDERFVDWGGEDDEFYERCGLLNQDSYGYLHFVHLWHPPQPSKFGKARQNSEHLLQRILQDLPAKRADLLLSSRKSRL